MNGRSWHLDDHFWNDDVKVGDDIDDRSHIQTLLLSQMLVSHDVDIY